MASRLISAITDPRPRYQPEAKPRADIEFEGLILLILTVEAMVYILYSIVYRHIWSLVV